LNLVKTALRIRVSIPKYPGYTLFELLVVISVFIVLGGMTFSAFDGLQNTIKMNEYMLTLEQDIRNVQRASMLLQRSPGEKWVYGLGIDFSKVQEDGVYYTFKWCSSFDDYGDVTTKSSIPGYYPGYIIGSAPVPSMPAGFVNAKLPIPVGGALISNRSYCEEGGVLRTLPGYDRTIRLPKSNIAVIGKVKEVRYILFESVSGRAFFYDILGNLLNYELTTGEIVSDQDDREDFLIQVDPIGSGSTRKLSVKNLSGRIDAYILND
jgi:type II secretory pathway pseudopilin PulG